MESYTLDVKERRVKMNKKDHVVGRHDTDRHVVSHYTGPSDEEQSAY